jgi:hypothetical protein
MLMLDVRNAIAGILDRYSLADVVEVTLRKMRRDGIAPPFSEPVPVARSRHAKALHPRLHPVEGIVQQLLGDYSI